jgi:hypothetical protein
VHQLAHLHAVSHVVRFVPSSLSRVFADPRSYLTSHASIDPKVRKERNLPEDLIRLCVGIEDPEDLIDDLEAALLEAGAVRVVDEAGSRAKLERVRTAEEKDEEEGEEVKVEEEVDSLIVSAPGKVILFGEHAVVHGIVSFFSLVELKPSD